MLIFHIIIHINVNEMQIKRQKSAMIAELFWGRYVNAAKCKTTCSNAVDAHWERDRDAVTSQRTPGGHSASAMDLSLCLYSNSVRYLRALSTLLETLRCWHGISLRGFFCVVFKWYAEPRRVLCECSECATSHDILQCRCVVTAQYEIQLPAPWLFILYDLYSFLIHVAVLWERAKNWKK